MIGKKWDCVRLCVCALVAVSFCSVVLTAEENDVPEEEDIVVIASPIIEGNTVDRYGSSSTVVSREQISDLNARDIGTALRRTPGVTISRYNHIGSHGGADGGGIFIRGLGTNRPGGDMKTFIDDVPMYMGVYNHPLLDLLSIDSAESIEVSKSPRNQQFGNTFAGLNIRPKRIRQEGYHTEIGLASGSYNTFMQTFEHGGKVDAWDYYIGQSYRSSDGHRDDSGGILRNYFGRLGYELNDNWDVSLFGLHTDNVAGDPGPRDGTPGEKYETETWMGSVSFDHTYESFEGSVKAFINSGGAVETSGSLPEFQFTGIKAQETLYPWEGTEIDIGLDYEEIRGKRRTRNVRGGPTIDTWRGPVQRILSPSVGLSQFIGSRDGLYIVPSVGARYYDHNRFSSETAPNAGMIWGYSNTQFHVSWSRGVSYPGLEIWRFGGDADTLNAEKMDHYELGVNHTWERLRAELTLFRARGKDRYMVFGPDAFQNIDSYRTEGIEPTITYYPVDELSVFVGGTYLVTDPRDMPYSPRRTLSSGLNWNFLDDYVLNLDAQYVSSMYGTAEPRSPMRPSDDDEVGSHFLLNGKLSYHLNFQTFGMPDAGSEIFIAAENITDRRYEYRPGYPMPRFNVMAGLNMRF